MLVFGHRGAMGYEFENTIKSFQKALEQKVDMIELDVHRCKSGELVITHRYRIDETTDGEGYVRDYTLDELRNYKLKGHGGRLLVLEEALDFLDGRVRLNIEIKSEKTALKLVTILRKYLETEKWKEDDFLISSFNHKELEEVKRLLPALPIGTLVDSVLTDYALEAEKIGSYSLNISSDFVNKNLIDDAHKRGLKVFVFTHMPSFSKRDVQEMKKLGVDGLFANFPDKVRKFLK